jgi:hypothetical protein
LYRQIKSAQSTILTTLLTRINTIQYIILNLRLREFKLQTNKQDIIKHKIRLKNAIANSNCT